MTSEEQPRNNPPQAQPVHAARSHERPKGVTAHTHAATQAERAVMHPATGTGPDDYFDPDWRCYYAAVA